jgi:ribonuclease Z
VEHQISKEGEVQDDGKFKIEAAFLEHGIENIGWRIKEADRIKFKKELLKKYNVKGPNVKKLQRDKKIKIDGKIIKLEDVSYIKKGDSVSIVIDTKKCKSAVDIAKGSKILICESTYLEKDKKLATKYMHMTAKQAASIAKEAGVEMLILTHFSARYLNMNLFEKEAKKVFENTIVAEDFKRIKFPK